MPIKQLERRCHGLLPKVVIARWRSARVIFCLGPIPADRVWSYGAQFTKYLTIYREIIVR